MLPKAATKAESVMLACVSVLLSLLLWLQVMSQAQPNSRKELLIALKSQSVPNDLMVTQIPDGVTVTIEGPEAQLERIEPSQIVATVDLATFKPGTHNVRVSLPEIRDTLSISIKRPTVPVSLEKIAEASHKVEVQMQGSLNPDLQLEGSSSQPSFIKVIGPASEVSRVRRVRALVDLELVKPGLIQQSKLEILDKDNVPITMVRSEPETVNVLPRLAAAPSSRNVLINPSWKGQPGFGYEVKSYSITPNSVQLAGPSEMLATFTTISTMPIDITGLTQSRKFTVVLDLPGRVSLANPKPIEVEVLIQRSKP